MAFKEVLISGSVTPSNLLAGGASTNVLKTDATALYWGSDSSYSNADAIAAVEAHGSAFTVDVTGNAAEVSGTDDTNVAGSGQTGIAYQAVLIHTGVNVFNDMDANNVTAKGSGAIITAAERTNFTSAHTDFSASTKENTESTIVKRATASSEEDNPNGFAAGTITATFVGDLTGNVTGDVSLNAADAGGPDDSVLWGGPAGSGEIYSTVKTVGNQTIRGNKTFSGNTVIESDLTIDGDYFEIHGENTRVADNTVEANIEEGGGAYSEQASAIIFGHSTATSGAKIVNSVAGELEITDLHASDEANSGTVNAGNYIDIYTGSIIADFMVRGKSANFSANTCDTARGNLYFDTDVNKLLVHIGTPPPGGQ